MGHLQYIPDVDRVFRQAEHLVYRKVDVLQTELRVPTDEVPNHPLPEDVLLNLYTQRLLWELFDILLLAVLLNLGLDDGIGLDLSGAVVKNGPQVSLLKLHNLLSLREVQQVDLLPESRLLRALDGHRLVLEMFQVDPDGHVVRVLVKLPDHLLLQPVSALVRGHTLL